MPDREVVALVGDGGAAFTISELALAVELGLPLPIVIVNDGGYGEIRREMAARGQAPIGVDLLAPDFALLARAFGARGVTIHDPGSLPALLAEGFAAPAPTLIEVRVESA